MRLNENSQCSKILTALQIAAAERAAGAGHEGWVPMPLLVTVSGSYNIHSRVDELRSRHGVPIENKTDQTVRPHQSFYRLAGTPANN